jgi:hypothetical protein
MTAGSLVNSWGRIQGMRPAPAPNTRPWSPPMTISDSSSLRALCSDRFAPRMNSGIKDCAVWQSGSAKTAKKAYKPIITCTDGEPIMNKRHDLDCWKCKVFWDGSVKVVKGGQISIQELQGKVDSTTFAYRWVFIRHTVFERAGPNSEMVSTIWWCMGRPESCSLQEKLSRWSETRLTNQYSQFRTILIKADKQEALQLPAYA